MEKIGIEGPRLDRGSVDAFTCLRGVHS